MSTEMQNLSEQLEVKADRSDLDKFGAKHGNVAQAVEALEVWRW